jgi:hypothetical protein
MGRGRGDGRSTRTSRARRDASAVASAFVRMDFVSRARRRRSVDGGDASAGRARMTARGWARLGLFGLDDASRRARATDDDD